jgi:hypothetical protein
MQLYYYVQRGEQQFGPYLSDALLDDIAAGNIALTDLVYLEDRQEWAPLEAAPLIQALFENVEKPQGSSVASSEVEPIPSAVESLPEVPRKPIAIESELDLEMLETEEEAAVIEKPTPAAQQAHGFEVAQISSAEAVHDLNFKDGIAKVEIEPTAKGQLTIEVQDGKSEALTIEVRAARAVRLILKAEESSSVGNLSSVIVTAIDSFGNVDEECDAELTIKYSGSAMGVGRIQMKNGTGNFGVRSEKATISSFVVSAAGPWEDLQGTDGAIEFKAGPAMRFEIVAPQSVQAGQRSEIRVLARDQFGNQTSRVDADVRLAIQHFVS